MLNGKVSADKELMEAKMKFRGHETFFIRKGWLSKGLKNVMRDPSVFMGNNGKPMDILGIGSNMVKSLRYWLQSVGLTTEPTSGRREQTLTPLGKVIAENDPYMEELGTLWLLHYCLAKNNKDATAWYYFFNEFKLTEFERADFLRHISAYLRLHDEEVSERSLEDDYNCIVSTYLPRNKYNPEKMQPESNIDCPFGELELLDVVDRKGKVYRKICPKKETLPPLIVLAIIVEQSNGEKEIKISDLQNGACNIGRVFNLDIITLTSVLYDIELLGYLKVVRTAGLDVVRLLTDNTFIDCVEEYYKRINVD